VMLPGSIHSYANGGYADERLTPLASIFEPYGNTVD